MKNDISFFLGTNSGTGFHSLFYVQHFYNKRRPGDGKIRTYEKSGGRMRKTQSF